mmetsp:Transcript_32236/g.55728  ORF Transcript_32236/g.55728 Transcript_32236/m.55728 type:complete len:419 (-) Transcript_32236:32-1288(-)
MSGFPVLSRQTGYSPAQTTGAFGQPMQPSFGNTPSFATGAQTSPYRTTTPGTFGVQTTPSPGGMFAPQTGATGSFFTQGAPRPGQPATTPGLFAPQPAQAGMMYAQPQTAPGSMFSPQPAQPSFMTPGMQPGGMYPMRPGMISPPQPQYNPRPQFTDTTQWRHRKASDLQPQLKDFLIKIDTHINENDLKLHKAELQLSHLSEEHASLSQHSKKLFGYCKKVMAQQQRLEKTLEVKLKFENDLAKFVKDFLKLVEQANTQQMYQRITTPASFLVELLQHCDEKVKALDKYIDEVEEIVRIDVESSNDQFQSAATLANTLKLMQENFEIVTAMVAEVHKGVVEWENRYIALMRDTYREDVSDQFRARRDEYESFDRLAETPELQRRTYPEEQVVQPARSIALRDSIIGRGSMSGGRLSR